MSHSDQRGVEEFKPTDSFVPFSNGTEHMCWLESNCGRGAGCRRYRPQASSSRDGCPIEVAVALGGCTDGNMPVRLGVRGGFIVEGARGTLVRGPQIPRCPEYRGRDEPDDRPRRGPKPPADQMDLLDPRNVPDRERTAA